VFGPADQVLIWTVELRVSDEVVDATEEVRDRSADGLFT
jgi:hypothetical protein